jgi:hypothetical protein
MPTTVSANFTVPANTSAGGRLQGAGFGATTPRLNGGDSLQVVVTWGGNNPPGQLTGYFVFSPAPSAGSNQSAPSPFLSGTNYLCFQSLAATKSNAGQQYTFTHTNFTVPSSAPAGNYELTLVVDNGAGQQWSEDPEFDTTGG